MAIMPRKAPPFVHTEITRHGRRVWYFRRSRAEPRIRLPDLGTAEFTLAYQAALRGEEASPLRHKPQAQTFLWAVLRYKEGAAYAALSHATRRQRDNIFHNLAQKIGREPLARFRPAGIQQSIDKRAATPAQARNVRDALRGLFEWARLNGHIKDNPVEGVTVPKRDKRRSGFRPWTEEDVARYRAYWPLGTRQRIWFEVLVNTGLRRGDACRLGRQHVKDNVATLKTEKTGEHVYIPISADLTAAIEAGPTGDLAYICGEAGKPLTKESFGNLFRKACNEASCQGLSAHGLRKFSATDLANRGATEAELEAIFGWHGGGMASLYTKAANRKRLSVQAKERLQPTQFPHLNKGEGIKIKKIMISND